MFAASHSVPATGPPLYETNNETSREKTMIDARMRYRGKRYSLGKYQTHKEADAARAAALRVLDRVEADKPVPVNRKSTYPNLSLITNLVEMGVYDRNAESLLSLARKLMKRHSMVTAGVLNATAPVQTMTLDEMVDLSGGYSI